jgi:hypothetical protein
MKASGAEQRIGMAPLTDPERLLAYKNALSNWRFSGFVTFELTEQSRHWIRDALGIAVNEMPRLMEDYVASGGEVDEVRETRPEWSSKFEFHFDLRFKIEDRPVYIETRLFDCHPFEPDRPWIQVVNVHAP